MLDEKPGRAVTTVCFPRICFSRQRFPICFFFPITAMSAITCDLGDQQSRAAQIRRATSRHPERAADAGSEGPKSAKPHPSPLGLN